MPETTLDNVHLNIGVLGNIVKGTVQRGTTVREALAKFGFNGRAHEIRGWARGDKTKPKTMNPDDKIETDMTVLLLFPIIGRAPSADESRQVARTRKIIGQVTRERLPKSGARDILLQPFDPYADDEALRVTLVLDRSTVDALDGKASIDLLVEMRRRLEAAGEPKFPVVEYATRDEIESSSVEP